MTLHITAQFTDNAKARLRTALKLLGATAVRIEEKQGEAKPVKPDTTPTSAESKALADLFSRSHETEWSDKEITAFRKLRKRGVATLENITLITKYYLSERRKEQHYCRRDLMTLLNNFDTELDRARAFKPISKRNEWLDSSKVVQMPQSEEEQDKIRALAREKALEFKQQHA